MGASSGMGANSGTGATTGTGGAGAGASTGGIGGTIEPGPFTGTWKGYVENHQFEDGSDALKMTLASVTASVSGQVTLGDSPPLPPPSDPNVGYPPGVSGGGPGGWQKVYPGFAYSLLEASFDGQRLQAKIALAEPFKQWCELQTSYVDEVNPGMYACLPNWGGAGSNGACFQENPKTGQKVSVDCGKFELCALGGSPCKCSASGCTAELTAGIKFDIVLAPPKADGSVAGLGTGLNNVHLTHE